MHDVGHIVTAASILGGVTATLATVVGTKGSGYRRPGARMLETGAGTTISAISGGCLEEEIALRGREVIASGETRLLTVDARPLFGPDDFVDVLLRETFDPSSLAKLRNPVGLDLGADSPEEIALSMAASIA